MIEKVFNNFIEEAELFFVSKFITSTTIKQKYSECLDIIYNITGDKDPTKGIIAFNVKYGQGKSFFFDVVQHRHRRRYGRNLFLKTTAKELCHIYTSAGSNQDPEEMLMKYISVKNLFIDDIGEELKESKIRSHYSNKLNVIRFILLKRYEQWIEHGWKTFGTTNLTIEQIGENYDGRVADRLIQMTFWVKFNFLSSGSFRQVAETRKLTSEEVNRNWAKFEKKTIIETMDLEKHFNELIHEPDSYFEGNDVSFWTFIKDYLMRKDLLNEDDLNKIDLKHLEASELLLRRNIRSSNRSKLKHAPGNVRARVLDEAMERISKKKIYDVAENMVARKKFMELRSKKHVFI